MKKKKILNPIKITKPTPIEELKNFGRKIKVFLKRDDLNGLLISGNKIRKLEYLIADARNKKCDTIITCGAAQSNHCRTTIAFCKILGYDCHLFLRTKDKPEYTGNLLLDELLGATIRFITPEEYQNRMEIMADYAKSLKGKKAYIIPEGGSNEIGALGYVDCMREMAGFIKKEKVEAVYCAVGSGGTYSGLLLGKKLLQVPVELNGVIVCDTIEYFTNKILEICTRAIDKFNFKIKVDVPDINLIDGFVGEGYGIPYPEEIETIKMLAKKGILLEPVYTGKAFYGMLKDMEKRRYKKVLFIHTGGIFSIFAYARDLI
ncbi:MAG: D-cysteine desulfhydrase family protein [candidate division WOR-3 bacterium]|nr:D-cysteine desulfhydrase family protein [candidate division WOR-3 bacterium]